MPDPDAERDGPDPGGRLVSLGGLLADLVVRVDAVPARGEDALAKEFAQTVGGSFAVMAAAARQGMPVALAGVLGDDAIADAARTALAAEGIDLLMPEPRAGGSGLCLVMVDAGGERTMVTVEGVESRLTAADLAGVELRRDDFVYLSGYELLYPHGPAMVDWIRRSRPADLIFDLGPLAASIPDDLLSPVLAAASWVSLNAAEAMAVTGEATIAAALAHDRLGGEGRRGVVLRTGAEGCTVLLPGGEARPVAPFPAEAVDATGAGDTHVGTFVAAIARGIDPLEACRRANAAAAQVVAVAGQVSPPGREELDRLLDEAEEPSR